MDQCRISSVLAFADQLQYDPYSKIFSKEEYDMNKCIKSQVSSFPVEITNRKAIEQASKAKRLGSYWEHWEGKANTRIWNT